MISGLAFLPALISSAADLEDGADLHLGHLGIGDAQPHAAMAHHGVGLVQLLAALLDVRTADAQGLGQLGLGGLVLRHELVQRRVRAGGW